MRTLTVQEMDQASGGVLPVVGLALALAGKLAGSGGVAGWAIGSASLVLATYEGAKYLDSLKQE